MPAEITMTADKAEFAYSQGSGIEPWHGLGSKVPVEAMTAEEAIEASGMGWGVERKEVYVMESKKQGRKNIEVPVSVAGKRAIVRDDTQQVFAIMGEHYTPVQNIEAFSFFDSVIGNTDAKYHTVGTLGGGRRIWLMVRLPNELKLDNGHEIVQNILLTNSHDGTSALRIDHTRVNVVCANTLSMALANARGNDFKFRAKHTSMILDRTLEARNLLGLLDATNELFINDCNRLIDTKFTISDMEELARDIWAPKGYDADKELKGVARVAVEKLTDLFTEGVGVEGQSAFDAYMAITEFTDHYRPIGRSLDSLEDTSPEAMESRVFNSWYGGGQRIRQRVFDSLREKAGVL